MTRPRLLVLNPTCLDVVEANRAWAESQGVELWADQSNRNLDAAGSFELLQQCDAVILPAAVRTFPSPEYMARCPKLRVCSVAASGYEWLDIAAANQNGITVTRVVGGAGAEVVADLTWGLMLAVARRIPDHHARLIAGNPTRGTGISVYGKTLGILGLGEIGQAVARRASGFGMRVLAWNRQSRNAPAGVEMVDLDEVLRASDFLSLHLRLCEETIAILNAERIARMRCGAVIINTARRELIDEHALSVALATGHLGGAGLDDVPVSLEPTLLSRPNLVVTPHIGNRAVEGMTAVFRTAVENALAVLRGDPPVGVVCPSRIDHRHTNTTSRSL